MPLAVSTVAADVIRYRHCFRLSRRLFYGGDDVRLVQRLMVLPLGLLMTLSTSAFADQQHAVDPDALASTVAQHVVKQDSDRAALREALARPEVRAVAGKLGVDLERASAAVDTMGGTDLARAADAARQVNQSLVGGASTVVISTTTIIIALLVLIVIILAVK
jgi:hypothetical protein